MDAPDAKSPDPTPAEARPSKAMREDRLAKALRENLRRRKALSRGSGHSQDPD